MTHALCRFTTASTMNFFSSTKATISEAPLCFRCERSLGHLSKRIALALAVRRFRLHRMLRFNLTALDTVETDTDLFLERDVIGVDELTVINLFKPARNLGVRFASLLSACCVRSVFPVSLKALKTSYNVEEGSFVNRYWSVSVEGYIFVGYGYYLLI